MNQKERSILTVKALVRSLNIEENDKTFLLEKLDAIRRLARPEVLLDEKSYKSFLKEVENLKKKGEII